MADVVCLVAYPLPPPAPFLALLGLSGASGTFLSLGGLSLLDGSQDSSRGLPYWGNGWLTPIDSVATDPEVRPALLGVHRRMHAYGAVVMFLHGPAGSLAWHQVEGQHFPAAAGAHEPQPFLLFRRTYEYQLLGKEGFCFIASRRYIYDSRKPILSGGSAREELTKKLPGRKQESLEDQRTPPRRQVIMSCSEAICPYLHNISFETSKVCQGRVGIGSSAISMKAAC